MSAGNPKIYLIALIGMMLIGALVVGILFLALSQDAPKQDQEVVGDNSTPLPTLTVHTPTATFTNTPLPSPTPRPATPTLLPTAAGDDISGVLQAPLNVADFGSNIGVQISPYTITGMSGRTEVLAYVVKRGDTLSNIAREFGLNLCTIVWSNPWNKISPLMPEVILDILPMDGVRYHVTRNTTIQQIAQETNVQPEEIINYAPNDLLDDAPETMLLEGMTITIPGGSYGECMIWSPTDVAGEVSFSGQVGLLRGCQYDATANPGFPQISPLPGGYRFTQYFSPFHSGVDLAVRVGTPVYATGGGTISFAARHRSGYSNTVVIDHGTGFYTLYAHLSAINVTCGAVVAQGDVIGFSGNEGNSSGPHLHFEIRNGNFDPVDPLSYIGL